MPQVAIAVEEGNRLRLHDGSELVTLGPRDLTPRVLKRVPADKRVVVDRSVAPNVDELLARAA
jgi:hypothetical protein